MAVPDLNAIKTYRYLRIAMIAMVVGLAVSVAYEFSEVGGHCLKTSISAYYYTPVRAFFVSALVAIGVCLVTLQGNTPWEDALLNAAGMFAPVVAFVPTPIAGACQPSAEVTGNSSPNIGNNVTALLTVGLIALVVTAVLAVLQHEPRSMWIGIAAATVVWVAAVVAFNAARTSFEANAHYTAAIAMFAAIIAVVSLNALHFGRKQKATKGKTGRGVYANRYAVIAVSMLVSVGVVLTWKWTAGYQHWVLAIEAALITLFAVFWVVQTVELWSAGLRPKTTEPAAHPAP